jgi:hypothetical protein
LGTIPVSRGVVLKPAQNPLADRVEVPDQTPDDVIVHFVDRDQAADDKRLLLKEVIDQFPGFSFVDHRGT